MNTTPNTQFNHGNLIARGVAGGIIAGIIFALGEMVISILMGGDFFGPLRLISSILLTTAALDPSYSLLTAGLVGLVFHMMMSAIYGVVFVYLLDGANQLRASTGVLLIYGSLFGLALWVLNFLVIAPLAFPQFAQVNQLWNGFVAHTFFYGTVLGAYVAIAQPIREPLETETASQERVRSG